ncbi:hypothetical protein BDW22DRAFT_1428495 [Trametopsis cervina]|nr:hypothetical protein BDW22DRAFT_1428495 [Trametopsis cervina]
MLWNAPPFEILSMIFNYLTLPFPVQVDNPNNTRADYTESEVAFKKRFLPLTLVCRHWHAAAYPYLNRILSIRFRPDDLTAETETETGIVRPWPLSSVLRRLDERPFLPASVRRLRLIMSDKPEEKDDDDSPESPEESVSSGCDPTLLHALLVRFSNVRAIELVNLGFDRAQLAAYASTGTTAHIAPINLDALLLTHTEHQPLTVYTEHQPLAVDTVQLCIAWFGSVSSLVVRSNVAVKLTSGGAVLQRLPARLPARLAARTLTVDAPAHNSVGWRLHHSPTFGDQGTLRALHVRFAATSSDFIDHFVQPGENIVEELHLDFTVWLTVYREIMVRALITGRPLPTTLNTEPRMDLGALPRLRELTVRFTLAYDGWTIVPRIINTLLLRPQSGKDGHPPPPLRHVTLAPQVDGKIDDSELGFARMSAMLAGVPTLERCTLDLREVDDASERLEQHKAWFNEQMSELHAKGILHFVV